jgi:hypothetical protein
MVGSPEFMAQAAERMRRNRCCAEFNAKHAAAMARPKVRAAHGEHAARRRGGVIPDGYGELYEMMRKKVGAVEALRLVRLQRGADMLVGPNRFP